MGRVSRSPFGRMNSFSCLWHYLYHNISLTVMAYALETLFGLAPYASETLEELQLKVAREEEVKVRSTYN